MCRTGSASTRCIFLPGQPVLRGLPIELEEAALIDAANRFQIPPILLPLSKPVIASITVFALLQHYNSFIEPLIFLRSMDELTMALGIRAPNDTNVQNWELAFAAGTMMKAAPQSCCPFIFAQRYFVQGIALTGFGVAANLHALRPVKSTACKRVQPPALAGICGRGSRHCVRLSGRLAALLEVSAPGLVACCACAARRQPVVPPNTASWPTLPGHSTRRRRPPGCKRPPTRGASGRFRRPLRLTLAAAPLVRLECYRNETLVLDPPPTCTIRGDLRVHPLAADETRWLLAFALWERRAAPRQRAKNSAG